jgi:hypothetical protein
MKGLSREQGVHYRLNDRLVLVWHPVAKWKLYIDGVHSAVGVKGKNFPTVREALVYLHTQAGIQALERAMKGGAK